VTAGDVGLVLTIAFGLGLAAWLGSLVAGLFRRRPAVAVPRRGIVVDGSNVMHWRDNQPSIATVRLVVDALAAEGWTPGVVFDANAGYKLTGRYMNDLALAHLLDLPVAQVLVVPKGMQADGFLLDTARRLQGPVVSNDRFRDWAETYPEVAQPGTLRRGGVHDGKLWLAPL
jgi:hypothetical protein